ncbi:Uncharacterised protein [uncultured archaeon]|nr:Uncharacterised protein [uncultured archaeon]
MFDFKIYNATEEDCFEYIDCMERLENLGLEKKEIDKMILDCSNCYLCGRCTVKTRNLFLGAKTC